ncbi:FAD-dependent oxidoreductase [Desulfomonile tiedjei]|uniref:NADH:flavin oxidoreductase n=1 Tax=Desulfomonile tiedjei (strain ATCC 49306 / DSM 6799 / DCB-1) TaxID=706587 RepID=I4C1X4_DESTA|nr:FAD-dependent oxidoreductase [Desulfomonile tiedjei]AFM23565.1 NADH:flavin oxidoreductase [Desulfomonile tiedjei DSM 6799]
MSAQGFPHIFGEGKVGKFTVGNRIKYAACCVSNFNSRDGFLTEREFARDQVIAQTGASIMTNQGAYPDTSGEGKAYHSQLCINDDRYIPGLQRISNLFHDNNAVAIQQILHGGRYGGIDLGYCVQPSDTPQTLKHFRPPRAMSKEEIQRAVNDHAVAAERAVKAGYDGVEVTSFLGYLLSCFLSPFTNKRTDEYGGSVEKRARFMVEILEALRKAVGPERLVIIRLNGTELMDEYGGNTVDECMEIMKIAAGCGVDMISMVIGWHESRQGALGRDVSRTEWLHLAEKAKKHIGDVPLAFGPRLSDPYEADKAIANGVFDYWEICRPLLSDPEMIHKIENGTPERIKPCIGCMLCLAKMFYNQPYICAVNPRLGHEVEPEYSIRPAAFKKKVMVAGGGPGGLEAAIAASQRGHDVTIFESSDELGGGLIPSSKDISGGQVLLELLQYYKYRVEDLGISVRLNTPVNRRVAAEFDPDVVIVATGAAVKKPEIPGVDSEIVWDAWKALSAENWVNGGPHVVILGGGKVGLTVAEVLAEQGKKPVIVESDKRVDFDVSMTFKWRHNALVKKLNIQVLTEAKPLSIESGSVKIRDKDGHEHDLPADMVILAGPIGSRQELTNELEYFCDELYVVGDAMVPRSLYNAIHDGFRIGARI